MTQSEILQKAIEKAVKNGLDKHLLPSDYEVECLANRCWLDAGDELIDMKTIIFSHSFAKAFWKGVIIMGGSVPHGIESWRYHLQQMVLEEDPISYLEKFL